MHCVLSVIKPTDPVNTAHGGRGGNLKMTALTQSLLQIVPYADFVSNHQSLPLL